VLDLGFDVFDAEAARADEEGSDVPDLEQLQQADESAGVGFDYRFEPQRGGGIGWRHDRVPRLRADANSQRRPASADAGRRI
jgi:protein tyrosine phosphatase (PTP) superfamily phosphohydrolase (DUF442 family)